MESLLAMLLEIGKRAGFYDSGKLRSEWEKMEKCPEKNIFVEAIKSELRKYVKELLPSYFPFKEFLADALLTLPARACVSQLFNIFDSYLEKNFEYSKLSVEELVPKIFAYLSDGNGRGNSLSKQVE
jgi:hypothetical protein